jgi:geranylgeranyl pyrophosphate synthase
LTGRLLGEAEELHQALIEKYDNRFGEGTAIFVGNIAYALAANTIMSSGFPEDKIARVLPLLSKGFMEVNESQMLDLLFEYKNVDVDEWHVMASKRAASLFKVAMLMGAILGGASENDLQILKESAENMGYSFDIQDDIIDTFTQKEQYGRPPCGDIILGKKPLHIIYALNSADKKQSESLRTLLGKKTLVKEDINLIRMAIRASGGLDAAKNHSKNHSEKAKKGMALTNLKSDVKEFFNSLVTYVDESLEWYS